MKQNEINLESARLRKQLATLAERRAKLEAEQKAVNERTAAFALQLRHDARLKLRTVAKNLDLSVARVWNLENGVGSKWTADMLESYIAAVAAGREAA